MRKEVFTVSPVVYLLTAKLLRLHLPFFDYLGEIYLENKDNSIIFSC